MAHERLKRAAALCACLAAFAGAARADATQTHARLQKLAGKAPGALAACIATDAGQDCVNGDRPMPMQSVTKMLTAFAALDAVDRGVWTLDRRFTLYPRDLSLCVQPIAKRIGPKGYTTTLRDLIIRAVTESDCAANDVIVSRLGGPRAVQDALRRKGVDALRVDRDERHLQTEIIGIAWRPQFTSPAALKAAIASVPPSVRDASFKAYQSDPRDTATAAGMTAFLQRLAKGELLSKRSTRFLLATMERTRTFPTRLKAGTPPGWRIAHKTGTSAPWRGITAATNDVGVIRSPDGRTVIVAAFLADSPADGRARDRVLADVARIASTQAER
jgi:beta-lactamase class A